MYKRLGFRADFTSERRQKPALKIRNLLQKHQPKTTLIIRLAALNAKILNKLLPKSAKNYIEHCQHLL
jgi:hypothetical protein